MNVNISMQGLYSFGFGSGLLAGNSGLKSTQQKLERQEERDRQVAFFENQKENLKNVKCETVEEIARKLELYHSYEDQIKAAKAAYNNEQIWHMMDESQEIGEKIAEAVEKSKPKTAEERQEELVEEITGTESGGIMEELDELMDEALEMQEELSKATEEIMPEDPGKVAEEVVPEDPGRAADEVMPESMPETVGASLEEAVAEDTDMTPDKLRMLENMAYRPVDFRV